MEKSLENVSLRLPVRIRYKVVQDYLRQKFIGEVIKKEENGKEGTEYAEVLALSLNKSPGENSHMVLHLQIRTLTSFFKNKILRIKMLVSLQFNEDEQELFVDDFSLDGENNSWIVNKFLQVLTNTIMYSSFREKMRFSFKNLLQERSANLNQKLKDHLEAFSGIYLKGNIHQFKVNEIIPGKDFLVVSISLSGNIIVDIENSGFL